MLSPQGVTDIHGFLDGVEIAALDDVTRLDNLPVPRKEFSSGATGSSSSPKLVGQFPAPSVNHNRRRSITFSIPKDARDFYAPVGVTSYLQYLVTEED